MRLGLVPSILLLSLSIIALQIQACYGCSENERIGLLEIKAHLIALGGNYAEERLRSWVIEDSNCCKWERLKCSDNNINSTIRHITHLSLDYLLYDTSGKFNDSLLSPFQELQSLYLSGNYFEGLSIQGFPRLKKLENLDLSDNRMNFSLSSLNRLSSLRTLDLSYNIRVSLIAKDYMNFESLKMLNLRGSELSGSIQDFISISQLEMLDLSGNSLVGSILAEDFLNWNNLKVLDLSYNQFSGSIEDMSSSDRGRGRGSRGSGFQNRRVEIPPMPPRPERDPERDDPDWVPPTGVIPTPPSDDVGSPGVMGSNAVGETIGSGTSVTLPELVPDGTSTGFFPSNLAAHQITMTIQKCYGRCIHSFGKLTKEEKLHWFSEFKSHFTTRPEHERELFSGFTHRASHHLRDMYQAIKTGRDTQHRWISEDALRELQAYWASDHFRQKSEKSKASRASQRGGPLHTGGSSTLANTKRKMEAELKRPPSQMEVFQRTHMRKGDNTWVDDRSKQTYDDWTRAMDEARTQQTQAEGAGDTTQPLDEDAVYDQVVGGPYKNRVYGKGAFKTQALSSASVTGAMKAGTSGSSTDNEVREQVHRLNLEIQTMTQQHQLQLEEIQANFARERAERDKDLKKLFKKKMKKELLEQQQRMDAQIAALRAELLRGAFHPSGSGTAPPPPADPTSSSSSDDDDDDDFA